MEGIEAMKWEEKMKRMCKKSMKMVKEHNYNDIKKAERNNAKKG